MRIRKPNFLIIMVDEQRFPPPYENDIIKEWREKHLRTQTFLKNNGIEFLNHYAASTTYSPGRDSIFTGQYPSPAAFSPDIIWPDPDTVPTFGDYLRVAGYDTFWKGKWHAAKGVTGVNQTYSNEVVELLYDLQNKESTGKEDLKPWVITVSFVTPHDITLFGAITRLMPAFSYEIDCSIPAIPPSPTARENLDTKPAVQKNCREVYPKMIQPLANTETFRRFYYSLQLQVDQEIYKVISTMENSCFYNDTIIIYTSGHGDLMGSHGGLFQKWYQAYEEAIHVPLIIHNPRLAQEKRTIDLLTSHVDLLPTIMGLADADIEQVQEKLKETHADIHPLPGRDLSSLLLDECSSYINEPIYFMTDDDPSMPFNYVSFADKPYVPLTQPSHIETVVVRLPTGTNSALETWKYSRYFGKIEPLPDEFEMYNLTADPIETHNLADPEYAADETKRIQIQLAKILAEQCKTKRCSPSIY